MQRGQSTVELMMGISALVLGIAAAGYLWPDAFDALVVGIAEWVATVVEIP